MSGVEPSCNEMTGVVSKTGRCFRYRSITPIEAPIADRESLMREPITNLVKPSRTPDFGYAERPSPFYRMGHHGLSEPEAQHPPRVPLAELPKRSRSDEIQGYLPPAREPLV